MLQKFMFLIQMVPLSQNLNKKTQNLNDNSVRNGTIDYKPEFVSRCAMAFDTGSKAWAIKIKQKVH